VVVFLPAFRYAKIRIKQKDNIMKMGILNSVRQTIRLQAECALAEVKVAKRAIVRLPTLKRRLRQLQKWKKKSPTLRQDDFVFVIWLFPVLDVANKFRGQHASLRSRGKLQDVVRDALRRFRTKNAKGKCVIDIMHSRCDVELRGGLRVSLPKEVWEPLLRETGKQ